MTIGISGVVGEGVFDFTSSAHMVFASTNMTIEELRDVVIWDLGSGDHHFNDLKWFKEYTLFKRPITMLTAGEPSIKLGKGKVRLLTVDEKGNSIEMAFDNVYYILNTLLNIVSPRKLKGRVRFNEEREVLTYVRTGRIIAEAK